MIARVVSGRPTLATVQMDVHFIDSGQIGELLIAKPRVVRATHSLIFTTAEVTQTAASSPPQVASSRS